MGSPERPVQDSSNVIFPRRKQGQHKKHGRKEGVVVTMEILETVFHMPLHKACKDLGVCATALKRACRKLGVKKWPYRDQQCQSQRTFVPPESSAGPRPVRTSGHSLAAGRAVSPSAWEDRESSVESEECSSPGADSNEVTDPEVPSLVAADVSQSPCREPYVSGNHVQAESAGNSRELRGGAQQQHDDKTQLSAASRDADDDTMSSSSFSDGSSTSVSSVPSSPTVGYQVYPPVENPGRSVAQRRVAASPAQALAQVQRAAMRAKNTAAMRKPPTAHASTVTMAVQTATRSAAVPAEDTEDNASSASSTGGMHDSSNVIFPRRKQGQHKKHGRKEGVVVTMEILETVFHMPLHKACNELGVCATALKRACRKLGVQKWPYRDQQCQSQRSTGASHAESVEEVPSRTRGVATNPQQPHRSKPTGGMREGTRGASLRIGARAAIPHRGNDSPALNRGEVVKKEQPSSPRILAASRVRENSSDFESSVDTRIAPMHDEVEHDAMPEAAQPCLGSPGVFAMQPSEELLLSASRSVDDLRAYVDEEEDFDSFDSEEDGLVSEELESWGLTEVRLERFSSEAMSLEDCLKV